MRKRAARLVTGGLAVVLAMSGTACTSWVGAARTEDDFARKAGTTAKSARASIETAQLAAEAASKGKAFGNYLTVVLSEAEDDTAGVHTTFDKIQPPNASADQQRDDLDDLLDEAESTLSDLRIAARRGHLDRLADIAAPLGDLSDRLQKYEEALPK